MLRVAEAVHRTDTGRQREANEDSFFARAPVFAVADGMGGAQAGEVASRIAVEAFEPDRDETTPPEHYLRETTERANRHIFELARGDSDRSGMGTTLTAAMVGPAEVSFGHVGDSRAYLYRDEELSQLTGDHSLVEELRRRGKLTSDQAAEHPQRSVITRALGPEPDVDVDTMSVQARDGDIFLLCSDGLTTMLSDAEIAETIAAGDDLDTTARLLVRSANDHGGRDNITVVLFRIEDLEAGDPDTEQATLVGEAAVAAGLTAESVRAAAEAAGPGDTSGSQRQPSAALESPAAAPSDRAERGGRWRTRSLRVIGLLLIVGLVGFGAYYGTRQVWFLGTDEAGRVSLYRGLPYELPFGVELYSESYSSPITIDALPEGRRDAATNHELRSRDDAVSLIEDLQLAATDLAAAKRAAAARAARRDSAGGGKGNGAAGGPASGSGGSEGSG